jgi:DnaJ like chaperone protein
MSIWEQLAAATADLSIRGLLYRDRKENMPLDEALPFTVGIISLAAKMAKADGAVTKDEVRAFKKAFKVSDSEMKQAAHVFSLAKQDAGGYEAFVEELITVFRGDRKLLEYVLEGVFHIAKADGVLHPQEEEFLRQVAKHFGFTDAEFAFMKARHTRGSERKPYDVLGVKSSVSNQELSSQYRKLVAESQPDEFVMRGMPKEFILLATEKVAAINDAYDAIAKERGI